MITIAKRTLKKVAEPELIEMAKNGSQKAFSELEARFRGRLNVFIKRRISTKNEAFTVEDISQQAFMRAFKNIETFRPEVQFCTWLFKIAQNLIIDQQRKKAPKRSGGQLVSLNFTDDEGKESSVDFVDSGLTPSEQMEKEQRAEMVRNVIETKMPAKYKEVLELRYYQEKSYEEICELLNIPLGTLKAQLFRAKEIFVQHIDIKMFLKG